MDSAKKSALEKRIVVVMLCVFGATFTVALKNLGVFGRRAPQAPRAAPAAGKVHIDGTLVETMQAHWKNMEPKPEVPAAAHTVTSHAVATPAYTAGDLRDPMASLLPEAPTKAEIAAVAQKQGPPPEPPPALTVRGVLWGGTERQAIINDEVYRVGDTVEGAKILSIDPDGVTIEHLGEPAFYATSAPLAVGRPRAQRAQWR